MIEGAHLARQGRHLLVIADPLAGCGYEAICQLAGHCLAAGLDTPEIDRFLDGLVLLAEPVASWFRWRPQLRDPGDEMVPEAAVNGRAQALVSFNRRHYGEVPGRFGIERLAPGEALRRMVG